MFKQLLWRSLGSLSEAWYAPGFPFPCLMAENAPLHIQSDSTRWDGKTWCWRGSGLFLGLPVLGCRDSHLRIGGGDKTDVVFCSSAMLRRLDAYCKGARRTTQNKPPVFFFFFFFFSFAHHDIT